LNAGDGSADISDGNRVTDSKWSFEENDNTADEIGDNLLQPEADADSQGGNQPLDILPLNADDRKSDDNPNGGDRIVKYHGNRMA